MYTIQLLESSTFVQQQLFNTLHQRVREDGRFLIGAAQHLDPPTRCAR
jgi:hypothetical protein